MPTAFLLVVYIFPFPPFIWIITVHVWTQSSWLFIEVRTGDVGRLCWPDMVKTESIFISTYQQYILRYGSWSRIPAQFQRVQLVWGVRGWKSPNRSKRWYIKFSDRWIHNFATIYFISLTGCGSLGNAPTGQLLRSTSFWTIYAQANACWWWKFFLQKLGFSIETIQFPGSFCAHTIIC